MNFDDLSTRFTVVVFYFIKYLLAEEVDLNRGKNSAIYVYSEMSDGQRLFTHNLLTDKKYKIEVKSKEDFVLNYLRFIATVDNNKI